MKKANVKKVFSLYEKICGGMKAKDRRYIKKVVAEMLLP
jgi:hypothetical protein